MVECLRCGWKWFPRKLGRPRLCPNHKCQSTAWDRPRPAHIERPLTYRRIHPELHELQPGETCFLPFERKNSESGDSRPARAVAYERRKFGKKFEIVPSASGLTVTRRE